MKMTAMVSTKLKNIMIIESGNQTTEVLCCQQDLNKKRKPGGDIGFLAGEYYQNGGQVVTDDISLKITITGKTRLFILFFKFVDSKRIANFPYFTNRNF
jgi:hypothetical protein